MDFSIRSTDENIREIEDIINLQKANGSFNPRQVAFNLPEEVEVGMSAGLARSLESGLTRAARARRRGKKRRGKWRKSALPDNVSWPSDSDITVLRMKAGAGRGAGAGGGGGAALADSAGDVPAGDGLHRPSSSSMVNLATLVLPAPSASKQSLPQELLLPLSSWERGAAPPPAAAAPRPVAPRGSSPADGSAKARLARFLRLYFCPCCTCLYEMERSRRDEPSVYRTATRRSLTAGSD